MQHIDVDLATYVITRFNLGCSSFNLVLPANTNSICVTRLSYVLLGYTYSRMLQKGSEFEQLGFTRFWQIVSLILVILSFRFSI